MATLPTDPGPLVAVAHADGEGLRWSALGAGFPARALPTGPAPVTTFSADREGRLLATGHTPEGGPPQVWLLAPESGQALRLPAPGEGPWALSAPQVAPDGRFVCVAGRPTSLPLDELFIYRVARGGDGTLTAAVVAGVALEGAWRAHHPRFVPDSETLVYLREQAAGVEVALLELTRDGESAQGIQGAAPSRRRFTVSQGARADRAVAPAWHAESRRLVHVQPTRGDRLRVVATGPGQGSVAASRAHDRVHAVAAALEGPGLAWVADGALWWAELPKLAAQPVAGPAPTGPLVAVAGGFVYVTAGGLAFCDGPTARPWVALDAPVADLAALPVGHRALARVAALGIDPPDQRSDAALAARADLFAWLPGLAERPDGLEALGLLDELADDPAVRWAVGEHLAQEALRRRLEGPGRTANGLLFALSAAGRVGVGWSVQASLCAEAAPRAAEHGDVDPPTWLALALCEATGPGQVSPQAALAAHATWRAERRAALDGGDPTTIQAVCAPLARRLAAVAERVAARGAAAEPSAPAEPALVKAFAATRAALEAALAERAAVEAERARRAVEARARAEREAAARGSRPSGRRRRGWRRSRRRRRHGPRPSLRRLARPPGSPPPWRRRGPRLIGRPWRPWRPRPRAGLRQARSRRPPIVRGQRR
ncbi:MAG: hypothetical protein H6702_11150 [Myxococcales bacterium]|nr:hypothetical protein [Myxococcales bacterium]